MSATYPEQLRLEIEAALGEYFPECGSCPQQLIEAMRYSLFLPGKRFRPILTALCAKTLAGHYQFVFPTACALEFIHTYSLIHDDLPAIDDDDLRRGRPTCHRQFGEDIAILAGDALFAEAFCLITNKQSGPSETVLEVIREIAAASGIDGMVGGQTADVLAGGREALVSDLKRIHDAKTGSLIRASARSGALLADASPSDLDAITDYAQNLGLAFQIVDDILDITGSTKELGKPVQSDILNNKLTFPSMLGLETSQQLAIETVDKAKSALNLLSKPAGELVELASFVLERTR